MNRLTEGRLEEQSFDKRKHKEKNESLHQVFFQYFF